MINLGGGMGGILGSIAGEVLGADDRSPLKQVLGGLAGGSGNSENDILGTVMSVVQKSGGVGSVLEMFNKSGLGSKPQSWVGSGANENIEPDQVEQVFGNPLISSIASKLGVDSPRAKAILAAVLPELINQITPKGNISGEQDDIISRGLSLLGKL